ncbi:2-dehydropantoate 2-reductase [compost metagenome]
MLENALQSIPVYAAITTEGAKRTGTNCVVRSGTGTTSVGLVGNGHLREQPHLKKAAEKLIDAFVTAGFYTLLSKEIGREIYRKLLINAAINPLTAIWRIPNGELLETAERTALLKQLCDEAIAVYNAKGVSFEGDAYAQVAEVCRSTASNTSSMLKDVIQGTPTEIDYINGKLVEMARLVNIPVPGHETVWRLVRGM